MAGDRNFDSLILDQLKLHNENDINLLFTRASCESNDYDVDNSANDIVYNRYHPSLQDEELGNIQLRRINSAIYAEPIKYNCDNATELSIALSNFSINNKSDTFNNTHHCESSIPSRASSSHYTSINKTKSLPRVERRCRIDDNIQSNSLNSFNQPQIQRYTLNDRKVIHISTSLSSCAVSNCNDYNGILSSRNEAHEKWMQRKKMEIKCKRKASKIHELNRKFNNEQLAYDKVKREQMEREQFLIWLERKKQEDIYKRMIIEKECKLQECLNEFQNKIMPIKELHLKQWNQKKQMIERAKKQKEENEIKQREEEMKKRREESSKAFKLWCEKTKNRPRPATQGLLPHQQATPSYINPIPWIIDDNATSEIDNKSSDIEIPSAITSKNKISKTIVSQ